MEPDTEPDIEPVNRGRLRQGADDVAYRIGKTDLIELAAATLLALATVASAWAAYQSTRWNGDQTDIYNAAAAARTSAAKANSTADVQRQIDVSSYIAWLQAYANNQTGLLTFYQDHFRDEFKPAFQAWLATGTPADPPAGTPFTRPEYVLAAQMQADQFDAQVESLEQEARRANDIADDFVLIVVVMAGVLFFAGVGTKFASRGIQRVMITLAGVAFVVGLIAIALLPQDLPF